jgi:hypothetical protein
MRPKKAKNQFLASLDCGEAIVSAEAIFGESLGTLENRRAPFLFEGESF